MQQQVESPTPQALADLVSRCEQINRFAVQLSAAEEARIAALSAGLVVMRQVLGLPAVPADELPSRQQHIDHWSLVPDHLAEVRTGPIARLRGLLVLDEHEQVKILADRGWRGGYRTVKLWRDGVERLTTADLMTYLARLTAVAQERAPDAARDLLARAQAIESTHTMVPLRPRGRN